MISVQTNMGSKIILSPTNFEGCWVQMFFSLTYDKCLKDKRCQGKYCQDKYCQYKCCQDKYCQDKCCLWQLSPGKEDPRKLPLKFD